MAGLELYADRTAKHRRTWTAAAIILSIVFIALGQLMTVLGVMMPLGYHQADLAQRWDANVIVLLGFGFTAIILFLWVIFFERRNLACLGFNAQGLKRYGRGFAIGLGYIAAVVGGIYVLGGYSVQALGVASAPNLALFIPLGALLVGFVVQGATEEIVMRGWLMQLVTSRHGIGWGIGISSLVFSLLHAGNIKPSPELAVGLLNIILVAVFLGLYAIKEGSLWGVCAWHSAWNWLLGVGFGLEVSGQALKIQPLVIDLGSKSEVPWWITGAAFGPEGSIVTSVALIAGIIWQLHQGAHRADHGYKTPEAASE